MRAYGDKPLVTIIIATLNCRDLLARALESIVAQSYGKFQLIIVDGGSEDGTLDVIEQFRSHISWSVSERDCGIYDAWNKGLCMATGEWICFLGAGDMLRSDALENYVQFIAGCGQPAPLLVSSKIELIRNGKSRVVGDAWSWQVFRKRMNIAHVGAFHHRDLFKRYGMFDYQYRVAGDYELLLRPRKFLPAAYMPKVTVLMDTGGISRTNAAVLRETYRAKVISGGRNKGLALVEEYVAYLKWVVKRMFQGCLV